MSQPKRLDPIHPGEILREDLMRPLAITNAQLARDLHLSPSHISAIVRGARPITAAIALRLAARFRISPETWLGLQRDYDRRQSLRL